MNVIWVGEIKFLWTSKSFVRWAAQRREEKRWLIKTFHAKIHSLMRMVCFLKVVGECGNVTKMQQAYQKLVHVLRFMVLRRKQQNRFYKFWGSTLVCEGNTTLQNPCCCVCVHSSAPAQIPFMKSIKVITFYPAQLLDAIMRNFLYIVQKVYQLKFSSQGRTTIKGRGEWSDYEHTVKGQRSIFFCLCVYFKGCHFKTEYKNSSGWGNKNSGEQRHFFLRSGESSFYIRVCTLRTTTKYEEGYISWNPLHCMEGLREGSRDIQIYKSPIRSIKHNYHIFAFLQSTFYASDTSIESYFCIRKQFITNFE